MPLYEYECPKHGTFEQIQKFSDPPLTACPTCGGPVEKLLSAPAIQFKGTGWYITDYARKGGSKDSSTSDKPSSAADKAGSSTSTSSSDSKPSSSSSGSGDKK